MRWLLLLIAACTTTDKAPGHWSAGKGDGVYDLVEVGPAPIGATAKVELDHRVPAYSVESYGGTKLPVDLRGDADAYLVVEGPLAGNGDAIAVGAGTVSGEDHDGGDRSNAHLELALAQP